MFLLYINDFLRLIIERFYEVIRRWLYFILFQLNYIQLNKTLLMCNMIYLYWKDISTWKSWLSVNKYKLLMFQLGMAFDIPKYKDNDIEKVDEIKYLTWKSRF